MNSPTRVAVGDPVVRAHRLEAGGPTVGGRVGSSGTRSVPTQAAHDGLAIAARTSSTGRPYTLMAADAPGLKVQKGRRARMRCWRPGEADRTTRRDPCLEVTFIWDSAGEMHFESPVCRGNYRSRECAAKELADQGDQIGVDVGSLWEFANKAAGPGCFVGEPELGVPVGVDADSLGRASELLAHDWSGNGIEGQSDDVQEVGGFLGPAAVHRRLQLHRDQWARFGDRDPDLDADSVTGTDAGTDDYLSRARGGPVVGQDVKAVGGVVRKGRQIGVADLEDVSRSVVAR